MPRLSYTGTGPPVADARRVFMVAVLLATAARARANGEPEPTGCAEAFVATTSKPIPDQPSADHIAYSSDILLRDEDLQVEARRDQATAGSERARCR